MSMNRYLQVMAPRLGVSVSAAHNYMRPARDAGLLGSSESEIISAREAGVAILLLCSGSPTRAVSFAQAIDGLVHLPEESEALALPDRLRPADGETPLGFLSGIIAAGPEEILAGRISFAILTNPTAAEVRFGGERSVILQFISPIERPLRSDVRGAKIITTSALAAAGEFVRQIELEVKTGSRRSFRSHGFASEVVQ
jgi:hypothetical protein